MISEKRAKALKARILRSSTEANGAAPEAADGAAPEPAAADTEASSQVNAQRAVVM